MCVRGAESGNNAIQVFKGDYNDQKWYLDDAGDGYVYLVNSSSRKYMKVANSSKEDYANVIQVNKEDSDAMKWKFEKIQIGSKEGA